jgi:endonuclease/exonuclease/phosphatase (EEP) superfamily protein YafD
VLIPWAVLAKSRPAVIVCVVAAFVAAVPLAGLTLSVKPLLHRDASTAIRVLTFNMNSARPSDPLLHRMIAEHDPVAVFLQETKVGDEFPPGWSGHRGTAGTVFASKYPFTKIGGLRTQNLGDGREAVAYQVQLPGVEVLMVNVHLPTPRHGLAAVIARRTDAAEALEADIAQRDAASRDVRQWADKLPAGPRIIAGDFNQPPESRIFRRDWGAFTDAFSSAGNGLGHTLYTRRGLSVRIDHILCEPPFRVRQAWVEPTGRVDHRPVIADLDLGGS